MKISLYEFQKLGDSRGSLVVLEQEKNIPFEIKRVYYMFETKKDIRRGYHAHKKLNQIAVVLKGECKIHLDDGKSTSEVVMNDPTKGLLLEPLVWHEMFEYSSDCILMILADDVYDENDYIRNKDEFYEIVNK